MRRAKEEAELANAAKGEFLSRMSHELRTPLHAILGFGELLERREPRPDQREQLTQIMRAGRHLLELINEVLDLSRIDDGALRLSLEPVDVGEVVTETLDMLAPVAEASSVRLARAALRAPRHPRPRRSPAPQAGAAQPALQRGEVQPRGRRGPGRRHERRDPLARIEVADTGLGIAPGDIERAFSAFERLGAEATEVEGTGLGLALTKRLIEAMGGTIGVESEVGRGTTFWVDLPEVPAPAARSPAPARSARPRRGRVRTDARTVLYIEDNPSNIKLVETILRERPEVTLLVAQQGRLGLDLAREHAPALVLLDLNLPDISGEEILRRLRADERTASDPGRHGQRGRDGRAGRAAARRRRGRVPHEALRHRAVPRRHRRAAGGDRAGAGVGAPEPAAGRRRAARPPLDPSSVDRLLHLNPDGNAVQGAHRDLPRRLAGAPRGARARGASPATPAASATPRTRGAARPA